MIHFDFSYTAKELAKATAVLLHAMHHHPIMMIPIMKRNSNSRCSLHVNSTMFLRENNNLHHSYAAFASPRNVEMSLMVGSTTFAVFGLGAYAKEIGKEISIPLLSEAEEFQQSLVLSDLELYTLEYFRECVSLNVPSVFIVLSGMYRFLNEFEQLYHQLEKRYDEFYSS